MSKVVIAQGGTSLTKKLIAVGVAALGLVPAAPGVASAETIAELIEDPGTFAESNPFWNALYESGHGYLDVDQMSATKKVICANREVGVPTSTILQLTEDRGYSHGEAQQIIIAVLTSVGTYEPAC